MQIVSSGSVEGDGITITEDATSKLTLTDSTQNQIADALVGVIYAESTAGFTPSQAKADFFSQAQGKESTIDTGAGTTALFDNGAKTYSSSNSTSLQSVGVASPAYTPSKSSKTFMRFTPSQNVQVVSILKHASCTATKAYIIDDTTHATLATATFSGNTATFASVYELTASTSYILAVDKEGAAYDAPYSDDSGYPVSTLYGSYTSSGNTDSGWSTSTTQKGWISGFYCYPSASSARYLLSAAITAINGSWTRVKLHPYNLTLPANQLVKFDLDYLGDGSYNLTNQLLDEWIELGGAQTFSSAKFRFVFSSSGTPSSDSSLQGYCIMVA